MKKPIIGVLTSTLLAPSKDFNTNLTVYVNNSYVQAIIKNGGIPLILPPCDDKEILLPLLNSVDGILFPGGEDVDTSYYNEEPSEKIGVMRPEIDSFSFLCAKHAFKNNIPILGICRGLQVLNVAKGGSLYQDLSYAEGEKILHQQKYNRSYLTHSIEVNKNTNLYTMLGEETTKVNTMHHQSIKKVGEGLVVSAVAPDGIIEAVESTDGNIIAVQWHPEELTVSAPNMNNIFKFFIDKARSFKK